MMPTLRIEVVSPEQGQNFQIVKFFGSFDKAGQSDVKEVVEKCVKDFALKSLVFDFAALDFINSEGIGYLMEMHTHLVQRDRRLVIVSVNNHVKDVFKTIGIAEIIPLFDDLADFLSKS